MAHNGNSDVLSASERRHFGFAAGYEAGACPAVNCSLNPWG